MVDHQVLAERFEAHRGHLQDVAYRVLGSLSEAEDAVQEAWLRLARADAGSVGNLGAWLRTVVSRVCLDMLRARQARREDLVAEHLPDRSRDTDPRGNPEREALQAESVGRALLVVLDALSPPERVAFVLHDMFAVPFDEIAPVVDRSLDATKQLASRARRRVRGTRLIDGAELNRHRRIVEAFLSAARAGDIDAVLAILAPDVVRRADRAAVPADRAAVVRGARAVAEEIAVFGRDSRFAEPVLIDGAVGIVVAPQGRPQVALTVTIDGERISGYEVIADPGRLRTLEFAVLDPPAARIDKPAS